MPKGIYYIPKLELKTLIILFVVQWKTNLINFI